MARFTLRSIPGEAGSAITIELLAYPVVVAARMSACPATRLRSTYDPVMSVSGSIGDHGTTIMIARGELELESDIESDTAPLNHLVSGMLEEASRTGSVEAIHCLRDPTRGGVATTLNEIALASEVHIRIFEEKIPVRNEVHGACEILGLDPFYVANEGKLVAIVRADAAASLLARMKADSLGQEACVIGEVIAEPLGIVSMVTGFGGTRIVDMLAGEQLPRIC